MEYLFIQRQGDRDQILNWYDQLKLLSKSALVDRYNQVVQLGIVGSHAQAQMIVAMHHVFITVFGQSPIVIQDNVLLQLSSHIVFQGEQWQFITNN